MSNRPGFGGRAGIPDRLSELIDVNQHPRWRAAGLPAVEHDLRHTTFDSRCEIGAAQDDVGRLAAQLLMHPLDSTGSAARDLDPCGRRAGKGDEVDTWVACQRVANDWPIAMNKIEHALRYSGLMQDLGEDRCRERRDLGGLEHHGASRGERGGHLGRHQHQRPVPRRDQGANADRLAHHFALAQGLIETVVGQSNPCYLEKSAVPGGARRVTEKGDQD